MLTLKTTTDHLSAIYNTVLRVHVAQPPVRHNSDTGVSTCITEMFINSKADPIRVFPEAMVPDHISARYNSDTENHTMLYHQPDKF